MNFLSDMGERPEGKTLDRFPDPKGNYQPGNCRWATWEEQVSTRSPMSYYPKNRKSRKAP